LWERVVRPWLERHPVLAKAEVRSSGRGLHAIIRLDPVVQFENEGDRKKRSAAIKIVQRLLPTDPDCPGITALTRPVGSTNGKNGKTVTTLFQGEPVKPDEVIALCEDAANCPFETVAGLLFAENRIIPCPVCGAEGSRLDVMRHVGMCYGRCGKVRLAAIRDRHLKARPGAKGCV
jgi:hypothetical protein